MTEADTCRTHILPKLQAAWWSDDSIIEQLVLTPGRIIPVGDTHIRRKGLRPDYRLFIRRNIPIAVVEAKAEYKQAGDGLQQAMEYAEMMGVRFAYASNLLDVVYNAPLVMRRERADRLRQKKANFLNGTHPPPARFWTRCWKNMQTLVWVNLMNYLAFYRCVH